MSKIISPKLGKKLKNPFYVNFVLIYDFGKNVKFIDSFLSQYSNIFSYPNNTCRKMKIGIIKNVNDYWKDLNEPIFLD